MTNSLRLLCLMLSSLALAACGGSDSGTSDTDQKTEERTRGPDTSTRLKAPSSIRSWRSSTRPGRSTYRPETSATKKPSVSSRGGASQRVSAQCHLQETERRSSKVRPPCDRPWGGLDGDYREACDEQVKDFALALDKLKAAWQRVYDDWNTYASGKPAPAGLQQHANTAGVQSGQFVDQEIPALTKGCYIASDVAQGEG